MNSTLAILHAQKEPPFFSLSLRQSQRRAAWVSAGQHNKKCVRHTALKVYSNASANMMQMHGGVNGFFHTLCVDQQQAEGEKMCPMASS